MDYHYPTPEDVGLKIPRTLRRDRFCKGFDHALRGGQLDQVDYFRLSFRLGFRSAKLYLREVRRHRGILEFPMPRRWRLKPVW
jgi:hypothetical protein